MTASAKQSRRLDKLDRNVSSVLAAMREGNALHLEHRKVERWWLSNGAQVTTEVAHLVIAHANVVPAGNGLFGFTPAQMYRFADA